MSGNKNKRNLEIDFIKIIACLGVVFLHTIGLKSSKFNNLIYYIGTISIPLFLMVNGFMILNKGEMNIKYILKKISRLLYVVIIWNIIDFIIIFYREGKIDNIIIQIIKSLLEKGNITWFWFMGALILLYICTPILYKILHNEKINAKFLIFCVSICEIIYIINIVLGYNKIKIIKEVIPQTLRIWTWITYFYLGGYSKKYFKWNNKYNLVIIFLIPFVMIYEFIVSNNILNNLYAENFYDNLFVIILTLLVFNFILNININNKYRNVIVNISSITFGIYIIHMFLVIELNKHYNFENGLVNFMCFIFITIISGILSYIIKKVPVIRSIVQ